MNENLNNSKENKHISRIDFNSDLLSFDLSEVTDNELALIEMWLDDVKLEEYLKEKDGREWFDFSYPIEMCDTLNCYRNALNKSRTFPSNFLTTGGSPYLPKKCGFKEIADDSNGEKKEVYVYGNRSCKNTIKVTCRPKLAALYKYLKLYKPSMLKKQRAQYRKNKDEIDSKHLICPLVTDIRISDFDSQNIVYIPYFQIQNIRKLIDQYKYNIHILNDYFVFQSRTESFFEEVLISKKAFYEYIETGYIDEQLGDDIKNIERMQYLFILKLLTQSLSLYKQYISFIRKMENKATKNLKGNSFYGCIIGTDRSEVSDLVKRTAISLNLSFKIITPYVHYTAMDLMQKMAAINSGYPQYRPISYSTLKSDTIYLITGLREFVRAFNSLKNDHTEPMRRQFEHFLKQLKAFKNSRYILLAGEQDEIEDFLNLDKSFRLLFEENMQFIEDKSINQLYTIFKKRVDIELTNKDEKEFKKYLTYNRNAFPFKNATLAKYLANYCNSKSRFVLPTNISDINEQNFMDELNKLVGMNDIKQSVKEFYDYVKFKKAAEEQGAKLKETNMHMLFTGNPGTGKTITARILAKALYEIGVIKEPKLIEVERKDLVAEYIGQTAPKTAAVIEKALGGVLFIDEAYTLEPRDNFRDFGQEAIATLIKAMEDRKKDLIVIFAGYKMEMQRFVDSNPGIQSRIGYTFNFNDYNEDELLEMFMRKIEYSNLTIDKKCKPKIKEIIRYFMKLKNVGNGRFVDKLYQLVLQKRSTLNDDNLTHIDLRSIPTIDEIIKIMPNGEYMIDPESITSEESRRVSYHEIGHALVRKHFNLDNIEEISITTSANGVLGYTKSAKDKSSVLKTEQWYRDQICIKMAGLAAEKVVFGEYSNGGSSDILSSFELAKSYIDSGFSKLGFTTLSYYDGYSKEIDDTIREIINDQFERAIDLLKDKKSIMDVLVDELLEKKVIYKKDIDSFLSHKPRD